MMFIKPRKISEESSLHCKNNHDIGYLYFLVGLGVEGLVVGAIAVTTIPHPLTIMILPLHLQILLLLYSTHFP